MQTFVSLSAILKYFSSRLNIWTMDSLVDRFILLKPVPSCLQYRILPGMLHYIFKYWSFKQFATFLQKIVNLCLHICCTFSSFLFFFFFSSLFSLFLCEEIRDQLKIQLGIQVNSFSKTTSLCLSCFDLLKNISNEIKNYSDEFLLSQNGA